jgi:hypothetical protein
VRMDPRWSGGDTNRIQALAQELVGPQHRRQVAVIVVLGGTPPGVPPEQLDESGGCRLRRRAPRQQPGPADAGRSEANASLKHTLTAPRRALRSMPKGTRGEVSGPRYPLSSPLAFGVSLIQGIAASRFCVRDRRHPRS